MATFHTRLREFRIAKGLSTRELAKLLGTSGPTITRLETGKQTVSVEWLEKIGHILGVPPSAFLDDDMIFATLRGDLRTNRKKWPVFGPNRTKLLPVPDLFGVNIKGRAIEAFQIEDRKLVFCDRAVRFDEDAIRKPHVLRIHDENGEHLALADYFDDDGEGPNPIFLYRQGYPFGARMSLWDDNLHHKWRVIAEWCVFDTEYAAS